MMDRSVKEKAYQKVIEELGYLLGRPGELGKYALDNIGTMATIATVLKMHLSSFFFVGFYRVVDTDMLQIGPYQGEVLACGTIPFGKGVCGVCAEQRRTIIVPDVSLFPGYIACDDETKSEIVVPVMQRNKLIAVLDVDGTHIGDFDVIDQQYLEEIVEYHF